MNNCPSLIETKDCKDGCHCVVSDWIVTPCAKEYSQYPDKCFIGKEINTRNIISKGLFNDCPSSLTSKKNCELPCALTDLVSNIEIENLQAELSSIIYEHGGNDLVYKKGSVIDINTYPPLLDSYMEFFQTTLVDVNPCIQYSQSDVDAYFNCTNLQPLTQNGISFINTVKKVDKITDYLINKGITTFTYLDVTYNVGDIKTIFSKYKFI